MTTAFTRREWKPGVGGATPVDHVNLNRIEEGIFNSAPPGFMGDFAGDVPPPGWLVCDGQQLDESIYFELREAIGTKWNTGDEETGFFRIPNLTNGRFRRGATEVGATGGSAGHRHSNPSTSSAGGHSHSNGSTSSAGSHAHSNPSTSSVSGHTHSNPDTGSAGGHSHSNPSTGSGGSHTHSVSSSNHSSLSRSLGDFNFNAYGPLQGSHSHSTGSAGSHSHSVGSTGSAGSHSHSQGSTGSSGGHSHSVGNTGSGGSHSHSVPDTGSVSGHSHAQGDTGHEEHLPPYADVLPIIRY